MENPITKFNDWWAIARKDSPLKQKNAVCVSTIKADGYPSGRFVDLKAVDETGFKFCTQLNSNKGLEIANNPKVAITVWWDHVGLQIRMAGIAEPVTTEEADVYWNERTKEAQLTTLCSSQSQLLDGDERMRQQMDIARERYEGKKIPKPDDWGGYVVRPISIEFLTFRDSRLHLRELFTLDGEQWGKTLLQP